MVWLRFLFFLVGLHLVPATGEEMLSSADTYLIAFVLVYIYIPLERS